MSGEHRDAMNRIAEDGTPKLREGSTSRDLNSISCLTANG